MRQGELNVKKVPRDEIYDEKRHRIHRTDKRGDLVGHQRMIAHPEE